MLSLAQLFYDSGFAVIAYDQRASGRSTDKYRGEGGYEANDLQEVIRYLDLRGKIIHPFYAIGFQLGGDAALLTVQEEKRIDGIVSVNPYLTTHRWLDIMKQKFDMMWFPFFRSIMWWWYNIRSSYAAPYRNIDNIRPITCPTVLAISPETTDDPEIVHLKELSEGKPLIIHTLPESDLEIFSWIRELSPNPTDTAGQ
jgi:pimeloyl-ACP methyl ester carboxylesterase